MFYKHDAPNSGFNQTSQDQIAQTGATHVLSRKSWVAYLGLAVLVGVLLFATWQLYGRYQYVSMVALLAAALFAIYGFFSLRSVELYFDDIGVWVFSGVFPWNKGVAGVKWRDLDECVYEPGLFSWLCKSYTLRISNRYTKVSEIALTNMSRGDEAVVRINERHEALIRKHGLE